MNRIGQTSPFGSINYTQNGVDASGVPQYTQNTTLSPELQSLFNSQIGSQQGISDAISGAIGRLPNQPFDASGINTDDIFKRSMDSQMAALQPQFDKGWKNLEGTMNDRGIPIGAEIWNDQNNEYNAAKDNSMLAASRQAGLDASNEAQRLYGNAMTEYNMPIQQLSALMGNSQAVQNPTFSPFAQSSANGTDVAGNVWNAYTANTNAANQSNSNAMNAALGIGKLGLAAFSDIRLKRDIKRIGALPSGLPVYSYRYVWSDEPQIGVMAQEAALLFPEAVSRHSSGFLQVRYDRIG